MVNTCTDDCGGVVCQSGETCDMSATPNVCKCGSSASCVGNTAGSICVGGSCKCTATMESCAGKSTGAYCDAAANNGMGACKCTQTLSCPENEVCDAAGNSGNGECKCGTGTSCAGLLTGSLCHSGTCKCSETVAACKGAFICDSGVCKCGGNTCAAGQECGGQENNMCVSKYFIYK